jgi:glutamine synthetase adenylyltransferase
VATEILAVGIGSAPGYARMVRGQVLSTRDYGYVEAARALREGYDFLRALESRLRIERDQPVEALDTEPEALRGVARRLGYTGSDDAVVAALRADHERHRGAIRAAYDRAFSAALGTP